MQVLTDPAEIRSAYQTMTARLRKGTSSLTCSVGHRPMVYELAVYWNPDQQFWFADGGIADETRHWLAYGETDPHKTNSLGITVEINMPLEGINRRVAGFFLKDGKDTFLAHSGKVGGGRPGIGKAGFIEYYPYDNWESITWPDGQETRAIVLGSLRDEHLSSKIGLFVHSVAAYKRAATGGAPDAQAPISDPVFTFNPEFEGLRSSYHHPEPIASRCNHGPVINRLRDLLHDLGLDTANDVKRDLVVIDQGQVSILFEAKTDLTTYSVYAAVGQLMLHGAATVTPPRRVLVVPGQPDSTTNDALRRIGIDVLVYQMIDGEPVFEDLAQVLG